MIYRVILQPLAGRQLAEIYDYIAVKASEEAAVRFTDAILDYCESLKSFPPRGQRCDSLRPGLRRIGYKRRVAIYFEVMDETVEVAGIYYGGQSTEEELKDEV